MDLLQEVSEALRARTAIERITLIFFIVIVMVIGRNDTFSDPIIISLVSNFMVYLVLGWRKDTKKLGIKK